MTVTRRARRMLFALVIVMAAIMGDALSDYREWPKREGLLNDPQVTVLMTNGTVNHYQGDRQVESIRFTTLSKRLDGSTTLENVLMNIAGSVEVRARTAVLRPASEEIALAEGFSISTVGGLSVEAVGATLTRRPTVLTVSAQFRLVTPYLNVTGRVLHYAEEPKPRWSVDQTEGHATFRLSRPSGRHSNGAVVSAAMLDHDEQAGRSVFSGRAELSLDSTAMTADAITLEGETGDLKAIGGVYVKLPIGESGGVSLPKLLEARAAELHYKDARRHVALVRDVQLRGEHHINAARIEVTLSRNSNAVVRLEARDAVSIRVNALSMSGARLTYDSRSDEYELVGSPVTIIEREGQTTGRSVIVKRASGQILIDRHDELRSLFAPQ